MLLIKGFTSSKLAKFGRLFKLAKISFISLIPASPVIALAFFEFSKIKFVLSSLPYTDLDFERKLSELPSEVYNYVVVKASRRLQAITIGSETLNAFSESDEMDAKRLIIRKKIIPKTPTLLKIM